MIQGEKINLRLVTEKDLTALHAALSNLSYRGEYFPHTFTSEANFRKNFNENGFWSEDFGRFIITDKEDNIVGSIYYFKTVIYSDALEIGFLLFGSQYHGKGYMTEALKMMVEYLFSVRTMSRIQVRISPEHMASKKVTLKVGFQFDGIRKKVMYLNGKHVDLEEYYLLRDDFDTNWKKL